MAREVLMRETITLYGVCCKTETRGLKPAATRFTLQCARSRRALFGARLLDFLNDALVGAAVVAVLRTQFYKHLARVRVRYGVFEGSVCHVGDTVTGFGDGVDFGALFQEILHHLVVASDSGSVQCGIAFAIDRIDVRTVLDAELYGIHPLPRR